MTVGELKNKLNDYNDDTIITIKVQQPHDIKYLFYDIIPIDIKHDDDGLNIFLFPENIKGYKTKK